MYYILYISLSLLLSLALAFALYVSPCLSLSLSRAHTHTHFLEGSPTSAASASTKKWRIGRGEWTSLTATFCLFPCARCAAYGVITCHTVLCCSGCLALTRADSIVVEFLTNVTTSSLRASGCVTLCLQEGHWSVVAVLHPNTLHTPAAGEPPSSFDAERASECAAAHEHDAAAHEHDDNSEVDLSSGHDAGGQPRSQVRVSQKAGCTTCLSQRPGRLMRRFVWWCVARRLKMTLMVVRWFA